MDTTTGDLRHRGDVLYGSLGSLLLAATSFAAGVVTFDFVLPVIALVAGALTLHLALRDAEVSAALGPRRLPSVIASGLSIALSVISLIV